MTNLKDTKDDTTRESFACVQQHVYVRYTDITHTAFYISPFKMSSHRIAFQNGGRKSESN